VPLHAPQLQPLEEEKREKGKGIRENRRGRSDGRDRDERDK
jgi:hypothetical protein